MVESKKYPELAQSLADLYAATTEEVAEYEAMVKQAQEKLQQAAEEKKAAALAAAAKKKAATKKNKKDKAPAAEEEQQEEAKPKATPKIFQDDVTDDFDYDLFLPDQFEKALKSKFQRAFCFGPVSFDDLQQPLNQEKANQ